VGFFMVWSTYRLGGFVPACSPRRNGIAAKQEKTMHKCAAGDLAVVVYAHNTINIGTIVKVLSLHPNQFEIQTHPDDVLWTCKAAHPMTYEVGNKKRKRKIGPIPDSYMRPIRGEPLGIDIAVGVVIHQMRREQENEVTVIDRVESYY
jgi:hypothetical protein